MAFKKVMTALFLILVAAGGLKASCCKAAGKPSLNNELLARAGEIFTARAMAVITDADPAPALTCYDTSGLLGRWALAHEQARLNYIQLWAKKRGVRITEAGSSLRIPWLQVQGNTAELVVHQTLQLGYVYPDDPYVNYFGIGTRHWMKLALKDGRWLIQQDFYIDGLGENLSSPDPTPADGSALIGVPDKSPPAQGDQPVIYDREGAVRYADEYAGLAWGAGNDHNYNPRYRNFNDRGGDCTNFVSQCLGDAQGGKIPMDGIWYYDYRENSGSQAWVRAESFGDWLVYSGRGRRIAGGTFPELNQPSAAFPRGAVRELRIGDVIGYGKRAYSEHLAIVVGHDSKGYPLVNAHNVDRFHCPWDMGCDKTTFFHLYSIYDKR
ncbi:MAG: amidase domain-containing protein [Pelotomaculum sp.]|nr:amidase domain-containing protein [Pelotomaculum sp.]